MYLSSNPFFNKRWEFITYPGTVCSHMLPNCWAPYISDQCPDARPIPFVSRVIRNGTFGVRVRDDLGLNVGFVEWHIQEHG
jgi:hypothetical protein